MGFTILPAKPFCRRGVTAWKVDHRLTPSDVAATDWTDAPAAGSPACQGGGSSW